MEQNILATARSLYFSRSTGASTRTPESSLSATDPSSFPVGGAGESARSESPSLFFPTSSHRFGKFFPGEDPPGLPDPSGGFHSFRVLSHSAFFARSRSILAC